MNADLIEAIQSSGFKACLVVSGGGSGAVHELLRHPGASRFVLDVRIPYSREAMHEFLGETPVSYCSEATARKMAETAFSHAARFTDQPLGIACTAALKTAAEREDPDRAFICFQSAEKQVFHGLEVDGETRELQEQELSETLLEKLAAFLGCA